MKPAPPGSGVAVPSPTSKAEKETKNTKEREGKEKEVEPATRTTTTETPADSPSPPIPSIVEPEADTAKSNQSPPKSPEPEKKPTKRDADTAASPPQRTPSTVAKEEGVLGSPPTSSPQGPPSAPDNTPPGDTQPPSREDRRRSVSEPEAQDALLDAAWDGDLDAAARALRYAPHSCCDLRGLTPLHIASERDHIAVAILLLDRGAPVNARSDGGRTPLHLASRSASAPMVEMLLERARADANAQTARGRTPLHYAASKAEDGDEERREVLRVLRDWGADPTVEDDEGETARDVAQKRGHWDAAATLRRAERRWEEEHRQGWLQRHGFVKG